MPEVREAGDTILEWWERAERRDPAGLAVCDATHSLTRAELSRRSGELAAGLISLGVRRGDRVGVCVERSVALVVALLGVVRAGAAYVAIDPAYPDERVSWMLQDCGAVAIVAGAGVSRVAGPRGTASLTLALDGRLSGGAEIAPDGGVTLAEPLAAADAAYVVYTSGSTGRPKGVTIDHGGLLNLVRWHCEAFGVDDTDRCTQIASPGFDAAVWEIWPSLAAGAGLYIVPEALRGDPLGLRDWLTSQRITVGFVPTAVAEGLITLDWPADTALRYMLIGGDALARRPRPDLPFTLINNYGVSEAAVVATSGPVSPSGDMPPSIGRPIDGVLAEVVDAAGRRVKDGDDGELVLGGVAVGRGYLNLPQLTAERFYEDERGRWYRTGDRMRFTADGELEFLGRLDDQLSIRGFRVEPGEVAAALNAHPAISASVAVSAGASSAQRRLVAYVVAADGPRPSREELVDFLAPRLPEPMHPSTYVWLDALPLTAHGKVDRAALPDADSARAASIAGAPGESAADDTGQGDSVETTIAAVIADLLGVETVGVDENFFLLGGHSLLGAQLIIALEERYDVELGLRYLFDHPTASELAQEVQRELGTVAADVEVSRW